MASPSTPAGRSKGGKAIKLHSIKNVREHVAGVLRRLNGVAKELDKSNAELATIHTTNAAEKASVIKAKTEVAKLTIDVSRAQIYGSAELAGLIKTHVLAERINMIEERMRMDALSPGTAKVEVDA